MQEVTVPERQLPDHSFKQVQECTEVHDAHVGLLVRLLQGVLGETVGRQVLKDRQQRGRVGGQVLREVEQGARQDVVDAVQVVGKGGLVK